MKPWTVLSERTNHRQACSTNTTMMKLIALPLCLLLCSQAAAQHPDLVPESGPLSYTDAYEAFYGRVFLSGEPDRGLIARVIFFPPAGPEMVGGVQDHGGEYEAFAVRFERRLSSTWRAVEDSVVGAEAQVAEVLHRVRPEREAVPIDSLTAALIGSAWESALLRVRYPPPDRVGLISFGGMGAHFGRFEWGRGLYGGRAESPPEGSIADALMDLGMDIGQYATGSASVDALGIASGRFGSRGPVTEMSLRSAANRVLSLVMAAECEQ